MIDFDTALLRTFISLAETKSFTATAKHVALSQSAVSMQIAKLESLLLCQLFKRNKRNVFLTPDGEALLGYAKQVLNATDALTSRFRMPDVEGEIRFGSPEDFATFYLPEILSNFARRHPKVTLHVNCDLTLKLIQGYDNKKYDLIVIKQEPGNLHTGARSFLKETVVWVGSNNVSRDTTFDTIAKNDTAIPLILAPAPCVYRARAIDALTAAGVSWEVVYSSPSFAGSLAAVRAGLGVTILPENMVPPDLNILDSKKGWPKLQETEICFLANKDASPSIKALIEFIQNHPSFN